MEVWLTRLNDRVKPYLAAYERLLDGAEHERWSRYKSESAALRRLAGGALLRTTLSRYAAVTPVAWRFDSNSYGRPMIAAPVRFDLR